MKSDDIELMFASLEKAADSAVKFDTRLKGFYTAFMVNLQMYSSDDTFKDHTENVSALMLNDLNGEEYKTFRDDNRFKSITDKLTKTAKW